MWKVCWNKGRLCWKIAKLFYFCHLKKLVRPETLGPYYVFLTQNLKYKKPFLGPSNVRTPRNNIKYNHFKLALAKFRSYQSLLAIKPFEWETFCRMYIFACIKINEYYRLLVNTHIRVENRLILRILIGIFMIMCFRSKFLKLTQAVPWRRGRGCHLVSLPFGATWSTPSRKMTLNIPKNERFIDRKWANC